MCPSTSPHPARARLDRRTALCLLPATLSPACRQAPAGNTPSIAFTRIPQADPAGSSRNDIIEGRIIGGAQGQKLILYAKTGKWWVQPLVDQPVTNIRPNFKWTNATHLGTHYAALLVKEGYQPQRELASLPEPGGDVLAVASVPGAAQPPSPIANFGGYQWRLRDAPSSRGGSNPYSSSNISVDEQGAMHLRIARKGTDWSCSEASLTQNFGYGTYNFVVRGAGTLAPAATLGIFTYDYASGALRNREMGIEIGRWGNPKNKNAQFVMQPFDVPTNVHRFQIGSGPYTFSLRWEPGRATFRSLLGEKLVAEHAFTDGVPAPGIESIRVALFVYRASLEKLQEPTEIVIEKFTYFP
jgi:hypothetical protein